MKLSFGNEKVARDNYQQLKQLNEPIATINAKHNNSTAAKSSSDDMGSLMPQLLLSRGAKVMLTRNLWIAAMMMMHMMQVSAMVLLVLSKTLSITMHVHHLLFQLQ